MKKYNLYKMYEMISTSRTSIKVTVKNPILKSLKGFIQIDTAIKLYGKNLKQGKLNQYNTVFINGVDM